MRDYSFGNFISALRERCGLSQYQLGALVGVSDKAVSKWENGASKPRIDTIRKLSEVLDVSVDELLTCEYAAFDKERKDLFAMKNEIIRIAKNKLQELYGSNPAIEITNRFKTEELMLNGQETLLWMGFLGKLYEKFCEKNAYFETRGVQMGASFVAWLLGGTNVNPLPAHYYCPVCKNVEFVLGAACGLDLADKRCSCGSEYRKDGFCIDAVNMYPFGKWNEIYVSNNGTGLVKHCLQEFFNGYGEIREIKIVDDEAVEVYLQEQLVLTRYVLLSREVAKRYPDEMIQVKSEEYFRLMDEISVLTVLENIEEHISCRNLFNTDFTTHQIEKYFEYAVKNDVFKGWDGSMELGKILADLKEPKFSDLISILGLMHGTGVWKGNGELLYDEGISLEELITCREDVYSYLYSKMNGKCCDNPSGQVFEIKECVRKGKYSNNRMPVEVECLLLECDIPKWYVESMKKIRYLFPKTHIIAELKRNICKYAVSEMV